MYVLVSYVNDKKSKCGVAVLGMSLEALRSNTLAKHFIIY